jgi:hypothetical protein
MVAASLSYLSPKEEERRKITAYSVRAAESKHARVDKHHMESIILSRPGGESASLLAGVICRVFVKFS